MQTFNLVIAVILFALAVLSVVFGVNTIKKGKSGNAKYNKLRETFSPEECVKRDKKVAGSRFVVAAGAVAFGICVLTGSNAAEWIGIILIAVGLVLEAIAMRK